MSTTKFENPLDIQSLSPEHKNALDQLQNRFKGEMENNERCCAHNQLFLHHFLKARKYNVDKAESMVRKHIQLRRVLDLDFMPTDKFPYYPNMKKYYTRGDFGEDKWGRPVAYFTFGRIDAKGLLSSGRYGHLIKDIVYGQELRRRKCKANADKYNRDVEQVVYILDLEGLGVGHLWGPGMEGFQTIARLVEEHTPEMIYKLFVINAPSIFPVFFKLVKHLLDEHTQMKLSIYGQTGWKEALLELIEPDQLPVFYGGTAQEDGDPMCSKSIVYGGPVPDDMYITPEQMHKIIPRADVQLTKLTVGAGREHVFRVHCSIDDAIMFWYIEADSPHNITFGIYEIPESMIDMDDDALKVQIAEQRLPWVIVQCKYAFGIVPEWSHIRAKKCQYLFHFDNTFSWLTSKHLRYHVLVEPADSDKWKSYDMSI